MAIPNLGLKFVSGYFSDPEGALTLVREDGVLDEAKMVYGQNCTIADNADGTITITTP
jgi:hypothetical protein